MSFDTFHFSKSIDNTLQELGYTQPTPIQAKAIQPILDGKDLLGLAQTGTGKTAAFTLPILQQLGTASQGKGRNKRPSIKALIISPTRELAEQTQNYLQKFTKPLGLWSGVAYGGVSRQAQVNKLRRGVDILVACPGRLLDLASDRSVDLRHVDVLVLDEADQMFDQGFLPDIRRIIAKLPENRQNLVFSATMPGEVRKLIDELLKKPMVVEIEHKKAVKNIRHTFFQVNNNNKTALLKSLLTEEEFGSTIIFTRTKMKAKRLAAQLEKGGFTATSIQGNLSQQKRQKALDGFKQGNYKILVATDIASRGIDVANLSHVINFDMPENAETYTHRTGRTGRAGASGQAYTFATGNDMRLARALQKQLGKVAFRKPDRNTLNAIMEKEKAEQEAMPSPPEQRRSAVPSRQKRRPGQRNRTTDRINREKAKQQEATSEPRRKHRGKRSARQNQGETLYLHR